MTLASERTFKKMIHTTNWFLTAGSKFTSLCLHSFHPRFNLSRQLKYKKQFMQEKREKTKGLSALLPVLKTPGQFHLSSSIWTVRAFMINVKSQGSFHEQNVGEKALNCDFTCRSYTRATGNTIVKG